MCKFLQFFAIAIAIGPAANAAELDRQPQPQLVKAVIPEHEDPKEHLNVGPPVVLKAIPKWGPRPLRPTDISEEDGSLKFPAVLVALHGERVSKIQRLWQGVVAGTVKPDDLIELHGQCLALKVAWRDNCVRFPCAWSASGFTRRLLCSANALLARN